MTEVRKIKKEIEIKKAEIMRAKENRMFGIVEQLERELEELKKSIKETSKSEEEIK